MQREGLALSASVPLSGGGEEPAPVGRGDAAVTLSVNGDPQTYEST